MSHNTSQKIKLLKIWEILNRQTDAEHRMTTVQLIDELDLYGISCERRSVYRDIETLRLNGYDIKKSRLGHDSAYYVESRQFSVSEIKALIDAVESSAFIPKEKTEILIDKLAGQNSDFYADLLKRNTLNFHTVKHINNEVFRNIEMIEIALENKSCISFNYFHLDENCSKIYAHNKKLYKEEPIGLVLDNENYYLLCYRSEEEYVNHIKTFRIDRIDNITLLDERINKNASNILRKSDNFKIQTFKMYSGKIKRVTLQFNPSLIEVVYDKFGYDVKIRRNDEYCRVTVDVQISPTFWGWMLQFPTKMKIYEPEEIKIEYEAWVRSAVDGERYV